MLRIRKSAALLSALALPLLIAGCASAESATTPATENGADWIRVAAGQATPSPVTKYGKATPTPELTLPTPPATTPPAPNPNPSCTPAPRGAGVINGLGVVPGGTSAVVSWYHPGGADIVDYRVTAATQDLQVGEQDEVGWTTVTPAACGEVSATVTGLTPGTPYVFSVDVVRKHTGTLEGTYTRTIARSDVVSTTA
ncbi:fibronectin type III domain-containing protein [Actinoplanes sp. DH11]|uniref:fibronectin type III domain-containing protein n=1 Tax=Actinoplanes sp. DH11 TaxID=2857011 RepID=UPI001E4884EF|nr:fibronectin type III domain-containing protein [Actinoplanes sp. DH11]